MASSDHVAGHPIAIRVGGRRLSQSHPIKSPSKATQSSSASTSPEAATNIQQQPVADYPRPQAPKDEAETLKDEEGIEGKGGEGANRKERRRQERKKDKYQTEEDKLHHEMLMQKRDFLFDFNKKDAAKGVEKSKRAPSAAASSSGPRITQPVSKFMS